MSDIVRYDVADAIGTITLDRPDKLNAYTPAMGDAVVEAFGRARSDDTVRVVILTGEGRAFCAGVDLDYMKAHMAGELPDGAPPLGEEEFVRSFPAELVDFPKPVIAAINGAAFGVGVTMTLGCDVRLASHDATLGLNFASLGVLPGLGSTHLLPQLVGVAKALELVLSSARLSAADAASIGLLQGVHPPAELMDATRALATAMGAAKPEVLAAAKRALRQGAGSSVAQAMERERSLSAGLRGGRK